MKKYALKASQPGERVTTTTIAVTKTIVERRAIATVRDSLEPRAAPPPRIRELRFPSSGDYFRSGAPARARYTLWSFLIVPFRQSRSSALSTHRRSELP